jgi:hypothetical protein
MRYLVVLLMFSALGACATPKKETYWVRPGASQQDFYQDRGQCMAQSSAVPAGPMSMQAMMVFGGCMQGKGWYTEERPR